MDSQSTVFRALLWYGTKINHKGHSRVHAKLRRIFDVASNEYIDVIRQDLRWELNPSDFTQQEFFWTGDKDHWEMHHIQQIVNPGDTVMDIGANFGYYALLLGKIVGSTGRVHAIEPQHDVFERLSRHISINDLESCVIPHNIAFSDKPGRGKLVTNPMNSGGTRIDTESGNGDTMLATLDSFCSERGITEVSFVKVDIEGAEERLIRGGRSILRNVPVILIEINPFQLENSASSAKELLSSLRGMGFNLFDIKRQQLVPLDHVPSGPGYSNIFCMR